MNDQIFFTCVLVALGWLIYKYFKDRKEYTLYIIFIFTSMQLHGYPFYLPIEVGFACWAFLGFAIILYKVIYQKLDRNLTVVAVMLFTFGIVFLIQGLFMRPLEEKRDVRTARLTSKGLTSEAERLKEGGLSKRVPQSITTRS